MDKSWGPKHLGQGDPAAGQSAQDTGSFMLDEIVVGYSQSELLSS